MAHHNQSCFQGSSQRLTVQGGQEFQFPHSLLKFRSTFLDFPQILLAHPVRPWLRHCLSTYDQSTSVLQCTSKKRLDSRYTHTFGGAQLTIFGQEDGKTALRFKELSNYREVLLITTVTLRSNFHAKGHKHVFGNGDRTHGLMIGSATRMFHRTARTLLGMIKPPVVKCFPQFIYFAPFWDCNPTEHQICYIFAI